MISTLRPIQVAITWVGLTGAALSLLARADKLLSVGPLMQHISRTWSETTAAFWLATLQPSEIDPIDLQLLNIFAFLGGTVFACARSGQQVRLPRYYLSASAATAVLVIFYHAGLSRAQSRTGAAPTWDLTTAVYSTVLEVYRALPAAIGDAFGHPFAGARPAQFMILISAIVYLLIIAWLWSSARLGFGRLLRSAMTFPATLIIGLGYTVLSGEPPAATFDTSRLNIGLAIPLIGVPFVALLSLGSKLSGYDFSTNLLARRLWCIVGLMAAALALDRLVLMAIGSGLLRLQV